jgi:hypothetical protein
MDGRDENVGGSRSIAGGGGLGRLRRRVGHQDSDSERAGELREQLYEFREQLCPGTSGAE